MSLTLYGSSVADTTLTNAGKMSTTTGGTETSKTTTVSGGNIYAEVLSLGGSVTDVASIPSTPTGKGWVYATGAGTFATGNWSATVTLSLASGVGQTLTIRFFKYSSGTYTSIGSIVKTATIAQAKTTYSFTATSMSSMSFGASDLLYVDLWYEDHSSNAGGDNPTVYESNSASIGVANDMVVTTSNFTPSSTTATKSLPVRTLVCTQITKSLPVRVLVRTQQTKSLPIRALVRTQKTLSLPVRSIIRTLKTVSIPIRMVIRTQSTKSLPVRAVVRTLKTIFLPVRTLVRTQATKSLPVRTVARTLRTLSLPVRSVARTLKTLSLPIRTAIRTQRTLSLQIRSAVRGRTLSLPIRTVAANPPPTPIHFITVTRTMNFIARTRT